MVPGPVDFREALLTWLKVGCLGFGGPAGQIALMHRLIVEEKKWVEEQRYLHALNFCMLLPGPEAQKLATYVGWLLHGVRGGLAAGILFVLQIVLGMTVGIAGSPNVAIAIFLLLFFVVKWFYGVLFETFTSVVRR